jgi:uncharacterized LabA/DUF88 family protein
MDEANFVCQARAFHRKPDWEKTRLFLANQDEGRQLIEMLVYVGLPPANMEEFREPRERKMRFVYWLRTHGFMVLTKDGAPRDGDGPRRHWKANVDTLLAIDAMDLATEMKPDVVIVGSGDGDFAHLALSLRRRGIRVEAAATEQSLANELKAAVNAVIDLRPLFNTFESLRAEELNRIGGEDVFDNGGN